MAEYEGKLIRMGNNQSYDRLVPSDYIRHELARLRNSTKLWDKIKMRSGCANKYFTGYVIYKNDHMFVLESRKSGYCEAFQWFDLLQNQKYKEKEGS